MQIRRKIWIKSVLNLNEQNLLNGLLESLGIIVFFMTKIKESYLVMTKVFVCLTFKEMMCCLINNVNKQKGILNS